MTDSLFRIALPLGFGLFCLYSVYHLIVAGSQDGYVYLGGLIFLELLAVVVWNYQKAFFQLLVLIFLAAGTGIFYTMAQSGRWIVLAVGGIAGFVIYMKRSASFGVAHLLAAFCIISAVVSSMVSSYPQVALLKTGSLFLVLFYAATGARLAPAGREGKFMGDIVLGCEALVFVTVVVYFVFRRPMFGNPNSLGAVMGVVAGPILVWGLLTSEGTRAYPRRLFAVVACVLLLLSSYSRAGIGAAVASITLLCFCFRRYRFLIKGFALAIVVALVVAATVPLPDRSSAQAGTLLDSFLYKGKTDEGIFGSREAPWQQTSAVISRYPWFGSGFGTSMTDKEGKQSEYAFQSTVGSLREHGSSYLAILEWMGLLGVVPFALLIGLLGVKVYQGAAWMRKTGNIMSPLTPLTAVVLAGLLHATFEDWLFAPGYYLCVFFWALAFIQIDFLSAVKETTPAAAPVPYAVPLQTYSAVSAGR